ncbi:RNA polymerase sigma factor [Candidatus Uabimicrobium amorphum]|uniref:RNA polymerase sigma factor n=1 Tax=Uabimicrobium amorphum TaxID=2596890 RepID=A0A5S9ISS2_UABAM|nr:sigma-70 family RNA polymerase sigma factor [Candidatus Uabimicrobium amorphum]BBM86480.1 RNA polymerase sigma factor [Candidatus Uabimicrobium amorphum]
MSDRQDEQRCILSCQNGDCKSFEFLFNKYRQKAYRAALFITKNPQDALDASQNAFIRAYRNIKNFDNQQNFYPWFYKILQNCCYTQLRRKSNSGEMQEVSDMRLNPAWLVQRNENQQNIVAAMNDLAISEREILQLKYFQELSYKEIAATLDIPMGTVMSRLYSARTRLRQLLDKEE